MRILIAGASKGLGKALVEDLKNEEELFLCSRNILADNQRKFKVDICNKLAIFNMMRFVRPTHLVCTAGVYGQLSRFENSSLSMFRGCLETNVIGPLNLCKEAIPFMKKNGYGKIILLSGGGATKPMPGASAYAASKAALVRFAETLAHELASYNIDVNCVAPGMMNTDFHTQALAAGPEVLGEDFYNQCVEHPKTSNDFQKPIELIKFLLSQESDGVTGKLISAIWDDWKSIPKGLSESYTLRRIK